jgi:hypothetical protein
MSEEVVIACSICIWVEIEKRKAKGATLIEFLKTKCLKHPHYYERKWKMDAKPEDVPRFDRPTWRERGY